MEIQTSETIETLEKNEKDRKELHAKLEEYKEIARERDEWKKKYDEMQITFKEEEIKQLRELYMARVSQVSQDASQDEGTGAVQPEAARVLQQTPQSTLSSRYTIPDPSETYLAPQFQESFNQVARSTMDEINRTIGRSLGRVVPSQRPGRSLSSSERTSRAIVQRDPHVARLF